MKTKDLVLCAMFVALIAVGAFIKVPVPVVPFTLQFLFTMLAGLLLGPVNGTLAVVVYIVLGLVGLPIFTQGGGPGYIFQPSFGYIIGFAVAAYVTGRIANEKNHPGYGRLLAANFIGLFIVFGLIFRTFADSFKRTLRRLNKHFIFRIFAAGNESKKHHYSQNKTEFFHDIPLENYCFAATAFLQLIRM